MGYSLSFRIPFLHSECFAKFALFLYKIQICNKVEFSSRITMNQVCCALHFWQPLEISQFQQKILTENSTKKIAAKKIWTKFERKKNIFFARNQNFGKKIGQKSKFKPKNTNYVKKSKFLQTKNKNFGKNQNFDEE